MKFTTIFTALTTLHASVQLAAAEYIKQNHMIDCNGEKFRRSDALYSAEGGMKARASSHGVTKYPKFYKPKSYELESYDPKEDYWITPLSYSPYYPHPKCKYSNFIIMDNHGVIFDVIDKNMKKCALIEKSPESTDFSEIVDFD